MAIQKINLSFKAALPDNVKNTPDKSVTSTEHVTVPQNEETKDSFTPSSEKASDNSKKYLITGASVVVGLTGLIIAGRKGWLGKQVKNLLHFNKNPKAPKPGDVAGTNDIPGGKPSSAANPKPEPKIENGSSSVKEQIPTKKFVIETSEPLTPEIKAAMNKIDSSVEQDIPLISDRYKSIQYKSKEDLMKLIEEDVDIKSIDLSKCEPWAEREGTYKYTQKLKTGEEVLVILDKDKNVLAFEKHFLNFNNIACFPRKIYFNHNGSGNIQYRLEDYIDVILDEESKFVDAYCHVDRDLLLNYNSKGKLTSAETSQDAIFYRRYGQGSKYTKSRSVMYDDQGHVSEIHHFSNKSEQAIKTQKFNENELYEEAYNIDGKTVTLTKKFV